jgi:hypothetical protein
LEERLKLVFHQAITLARCHFYLLTSDQLDLASLAVDQAALLQSAHDFGHGGSSGSDHLREILLRQHEPIGLHSIRGR